jgi:hypothetical protein
LLHEAVPLLRGLCSNALIGVYVIQDDRFVFVNERWPACSAIRLRNYARAWARNTSRQSDRPWYASS